MQMFMPEGLSLWLSAASGAFHFKFLVRTKHVISYARQKKPSFLLPSLCTLDTLLNLDSILSFLCRAFTCR